MMHDLRLPIDRARDGDRLALAARQPRDRLRLGGDLALQALEREPPSRRGCGARRHTAIRRTGGASVHVRETCWRRRRGRRRARGPGRPSRCRARAPGAARGRRCVRRARLDPAGVGAVHARDVLDQGRFAGAVVAHQRQHLARRQAQIDATEHFDRAEALSQASDLENRARGVVLAGPTNAGADA